MTRPLLIVFACAMIVCLASFVGAAAIGPLPNQWWGDHDWGEWGDWDGADDGAGSEGAGPTATRELAWGGGDEVNFNLPATITYTQGPIARITVSGPARSVERVELDGDTLRFKQRMRRSGRLTVTMTAPDVREFNLHGSQRLSIAAFDHDTLEIKVFGSGDVVGAGRARRVEVHIAGSGDIDLGAVAAEAAEVDIAGSGNAIIAPTQVAEVSIAGSGDVTLTTRPDKVDSKIAGSGRVVQAEPSTQASPSSAPTPGAV